MTYVAALDRYDGTMPYRRCGRSGLKLPEVSLGLWQNFGGETPLETQRAILRRAFDLGVTHFDLANNYGPPYGSAEANLGEILRSDLRPYRDELIISTKAGYDMWPGPYGEWGSRKYLLASLDQSLARMGLDYVDIFYSHRFDPDTPLAETMGALAKAKRDGLTRHIGVANFNIAMLDEAIRLCSEPMVTLQAECHPYLDQTKVIAACRERGLVLTAYCPLARGRLQGDAVLADIGRRHGKSCAQVALRWLMAQNVIAAIPRSSNAARIAENINVFDFELDEDDMRRISALKRPNGRTANPIGRAPVWDI
jgi:L-glyceraldehyde 3-phosphate reductase